MGAQPGQAADRAGPGGRTGLPDATGLLRARARIPLRLPQRLLPPRLRHQTGPAAAVADPPHAPWLPLAVAAALQAPAAGRARTGAAGLFARHFHSPGGRSAGAGAGRSLLGADRLQHHARTQRRSPSVPSPQAGRRVRLPVPGRGGAENARLLGNRGPAHDFGGLWNHGRGQARGDRLPTRPGRKRSVLGGLLAKPVSPRPEGRNLKLITTDGSTGLAAALPLAFPCVPVQLCWAHKMRNIADKVPRKEGSCVAAASAIYRAKNKNEAQRAFRRRKQNWEVRRPKAVACVERDLEALLHFFDVPKAHWKKVRTTNVIERAFREVRRRTRPISSFSNCASCDRIVFGVISHLNRSWERKPLSEFTQNP